MEGEAMKANYLLVLVMLPLLLFIGGGAQAQPLVDSSSYSQAMSGAWANGGGGGSSSINGVNFGMVFESHGATSGGLFHQQRIPGQLTYPMGPGYSGPWGQAHNFGVPVLLKTFSLGQLKRMGYSWWHTTSNNKWAAERPYRQCRIDLVVLPSVVKDGILQIPPIDFSEKQLIGWVNERATSDKADSMDVFVRSMLEAMEAGADKLIVYMHNVTFKQTGSSKGAAIQGGFGRIYGSEQTNAVGGDVVLGYSSNEIGPDVRPFIKAIALEEGPHVDCVNDGDPLPESVKKVEDKPASVSPTSNVEVERLKKAAEQFLQELNKGIK
jgi:hypothetical protein